MSKQKRNPQYSSYPRSIVLRPKGSTANSIDVYLTREDTFFLARALLNRALEMEENELIDMVMMIEKKHITIWPAYKRAQKP